jgi:diguanylate cyclase (GGDEF)-like protein/PAS domain S-box-containing protein
LNLSSRLTLIFGLLGAVAIAVSLAYSFVASRAALQQEIDARLNRHTLTVSTLLAHRLQRLDVFLQSAGARRVLNELDRSSAPIQVTARDLALVFQEISVGGDVEIFFVLDAAGQLVIDNGRLDMASLLVSMGSPVQFAGGWRLKSLPAGHVLLRSVPLFEPASLVISGYLFAGLPLSDQSPFVKEWFANTTLDRFVMGHESDILLVAHRDLPSQQSVSVPAFWGLWDDQGLHVRESQLAVPGLIDPIWLELEISRKQLTGLMTGHLLTGMGLTGAFLLLLLMFGAWVKVYHDKAVSRLMGYIRAVQAGQRGVHFQETGIYEYNQVGFAMEDMVEDLHVAATVFDSADGMIVTDRSLHVLRANRSFGLMLGTDHRGLSGRDLFEVLAGVDPDSSRPTVMERLARKGTWRGDVNGRRSNGAEIAMRVALSEVRGGRRQEVMNYVVTVTDVSRQKADAARIRQLAYFDPLTALPNRRLQMDRLERALSDSQISQQFGAILYLDLDDFKSLNDTRGHASGDHLLVQVAQRLTLAVRQGDSVARMGGDEFVVLLQHLGAEWGAAQARALSVAQAVLDSLRQPVEMDEGEHHCTGSIGVTLFCGDQLSVEELLQQADLAMYEAKSSGRNAVRLFQPEMSALALRRVNLEQELRRALANEEFVIFFQPIWTDQDTVTGAEVLLRWNHPEGGLRSGGEIIPVAEKSGLILPLGQWVLQQACHTLATWGQDARHQHWTLAVNVSVKQFQQPDFVTLVMDCVQRSGCNPARLFLELTESMFLDVRESDIETMRRLRQIGVRFSLDDFGTGYSSLAYLKSLPLDALKIDGTFVKDLGSDATSDDFVRTIVSLARALQLDVVAEGVETPHQRQRLVACGCVRFQGFLLGRPVPLSEMMSLLK